MGKVTSKFQVTIPKAIADRYGIRPGADIQWLEAGDAIRVVVGAGPHEGPDPARRLDLFDQATKRQRDRDTDTGPAPAGAGRGWRREDLYGRGRAD